MADDMNIPVIGLIENMSYFICPDCGKKHYIFGKSHLDDISKETNYPIISRMPINPTIASLIDQGKIEQIEENPLKDAIDIILES